ncbi:tumor protein p63-regulated gene 1-like protein isoform X2 [Hyla sarda]|uniref:tumor protein p63-regulated gene 1-like protein isoform X2 n=1 Tax=Hyla sarda TaxID=327740 RepID=UPI0024C27A74|nr:tumor protein p63-regulated gene 1-like protein isoform X2 [Hyla sarda]
MEPNETPAPADNKNPEMSPHNMYTQKPRASFTLEYIDPEVKQKPPNEDYLIFRPTVVEQAIQDIRNYLSPDEDGNLRSSWILSQISHWGTEREVIAFLCDQSLLICYYDFVELGRSHVFRIPLNYIDTVTWGPLSYPKMAVNKLEGKVIQIKWDKFREPPSFLSWWNPWTEDLSYINLIQHPGNPPEKHLRDMCELETFMEKLVEMVKVAHERNPLPGRANGLLVLQRPVTIDTSLGLVSLLNHKVQLGYAKSRWRFGF